MNGLYSVGLAVPSAVLDLDSSESLVREGPVEFSPSTRPGKIGRSLISDIFLQKQNKMKSDIVSH
jgi:hypothetical protein